jgi:hypothetical protein
MLIEEYLQKGLAVKKGMWYYVADASGEAIGKTLGKTKEDANKALLKAIEDSKTTNNAELTTISSSNNSETKDVNNDVAKRFEKLLGTVRGIKSENTGNDLVILIDGVDSREDLNKTVVACPFSFYWLPKTNLVPNGNGYRIKEWDVLDKTMPEWQGYITTLRDDSPKESYISVGDLILCFTTKSSYKEKKAKELLKGKVTEIKTYQNRKEVANKLAKTKSLEEASVILENDNKIEKGKVYDDMLNAGETKEDALAKISGLNAMDDLDEINKIHLSSIGSF